MRACVPCSWSCAHATEKKSYVLALSDVIVNSLTTKNCACFTTMTDRQDREEDCIWTTRVAKQPEVRQARLERQRDLRAAKQLEARQTRPE